MAQTASLIQKARGALDRRDWRSASQFSEEALRTDPLAIDAYLILGAARFRMGDPNRARTAFEELLTHYPDHESALFWAGELSLRLADMAAAEGHLARCLDINPGNGETAFRLGIARAHLRKLDSAADALRAACALLPNASRPRYALSDVLIEMGQEEAALEHLEPAVATDPVEPQAIRLVNLLIKLGRPNRAVVAAQGAYSRLPRSAATAIMMATALAADGQAEAALSYLDLAREQDPHQTPVALQKGFLLQEMGDFAEAEIVFDEILRHDPDSAGAHFGLSFSRRVTHSDDPRIARMRERIVTTKDDPIGQTQLRFALGKACDQLGSYEEAIHHYDEANRLQRRLYLAHSTFEPGENARRCAARRSLFPELEPPRALASHPASEKPVFVVGMLRSGTTLVEQILSSHPDVAGAGELGFWPAVEPRCVDLRTGTVRAEAIRAAAAEYLDRIQTLGPSATRVVDKNPANVLVVGLILAALPSARIIHITRHPADTALSIWTTYNAQPPEFACDRGNIAAMYEAYRHLAAGWDTALPAERYCHVTYESLIADPETVCRELVAFCGLPWHDDCLHPERNRRAVRTPSTWQVRQPFYASSVGRWKHYEPWIPEFLRLVEAGN